MGLFKRLPDRASTWCGASELLIAALAVMVPLPSPLATEAADQPSQCILCHTDTAKLKALTPPDPPPTEEGEG
jgi:hypothetical protein